MDKKTVIKAIEEHKIVVILRGLDKDQLFNTVTAIRKGGIKCCEVTYDARGIISDEETASNIRMLVDSFPDMHIGAGTVLTEKQVELTAYAGGEFIISPDVNPAVIKKTVAMNLVSMPGALTPSECTLAHRSGADFIKLFPNSEMKPSYLKAISAPLSHLKFIAVGGVNENNLASYIKAGAVGIGVSSAIIDKKIIESGKYEELTALAKKYTDALKACEK
ncbi:MAG: bifunctional 4-hydroxy-2-oxoglutarate aldolase/2-dehydro-3-deoxy-phosphogluconate aldolase [Clostridia bacterium]|nr:bifunctional 4-hydroxy-2-oxoglutarate aldolase/2-dehydro-3-deoxy-phosphogluconate aldolase [Clostridia bacterium]